MKVGVPQVLPLQLLVLMKKPNIFTEHTPPLVQVQLMEVHMFLLLILHSFTIKMGMDIHQVKGIVMIQILL